MTIRKGRALERNEVPVAPAAVTAA
jgi:hypothetical protein